MSSLDGNIPSSVIDGDNNGTNIDDIMDQITSDGRLDAMDREEMQSLVDAFEADAEGRHTFTKEALQEIFLSSLVRGIDIRGEEGKEHLQRILYLSGLDHNAEEIYSINRAILDTPAVAESFNHRTGIRYNNGREAIPAEDKTFTFKWRSGRLYIYEHNDSLKGNDILGYFEAGSNQLTLDTHWNSARDDRLENNNTISEHFDISDAIHHDQSRASDREILERQAALQAQIGELENQISELQGQCSSTQEKLQILETTLSERLTVLQEQLQALQEQQAEERAQIESQTREVGRLKGEIESLHEELTQLTEEIVRLNNQILILQEQPGDTNVSIQITNIMTNISDLQQRLEACIIKLEECEAETIPLNTPQEGITSSIRPKARPDDLKTSIPTEPTSSNPEVDTQEGITSSIRPKARPDDLKTNIPTEPTSSNPEIETQEGITSSIRPKARPDDLKTNIPTEPTSSNPEIETKNYECIVTPEEQKKGFSLGHDIRPYYEGFRDYLPNIESKQDIINLLKEYEGQRFPRTSPDSVRFAFANQLAISYLNHQSSLSVIDAMWGSNSQQALRQVQRDVLGFTGGAADGKPGPNTTRTLIAKLES